MYIKGVIGGYFRVRHFVGYVSFVFFMTNINLALSWTHFMPSGEYILFLSDLPWRQNEKCF